MTVSLKKSIGLIVLFFLVFKVSTTISNSAIPRQRRTYVISQKKYVYPIIAMGNKSIVGDLLWAKLVFRLGEASKSNKTILFVIEDAIDICEISPSFQGVYEFFGTIVAHVMHRPKVALEYLEKGIKSVSKKDKRFWLLHFYAGYIQFYTYGNAYLGALHIEEAARYKGAPPYLPFLAASLYTDSGSLEDSLHVVDSFLLNVPNGPLKESLIERKEKIERDIAKRNREGVQKFQRLFLVKPLSLDLVLLMGF